MCSRIRFAPGSRCFNISFVISSGPRAFFCFIFFSASSSSWRVRHSAIYGSKPTLPVFWSTGRVWVLTSLTRSAEGEAVLSPLKTLARTCAVAFPVTAPFVVCSVVLPRSELSPFSDFVSCQSFGESLSMLRDAVLFSSLPGFVSVFLCLDQPSAGSVFSCYAKAGFSPFPLWPHSVPCGSSPRYCSSMACSHAIYLLE